MKQKIDFNEKHILKEHPELLEILLSDRTTNKNIKWCTVNYKKFGIEPDDYLNSDTIFRHGKSLIKPRITKSFLEQKKRSRDMAEVFTPSWLCNKQINLIDDTWFGYEGAFNNEQFESWESTPEVCFKNNKKWQDYIELERLEITCGEAPYITSRYDTTNGEYIEPMNRIGILDRKLRVISENVDEEVDWINWAKIAYQRIYGYEWQGDSLLIARENLILTFIEFYEAKFFKHPNFETIIQIAIIISWNIWQMDGTKFVIPNSCHEEERNQLTLIQLFNQETEFCKGCTTGDNHKHNGIYCKIMDWQKGKAVRFVDLLYGVTRYG